MSVELLREVSWTTVAVEQAHASAACIHKFHPSLGMMVLSTRATLHQLRHLFLSPPGETLQAKSEGQRARLQNKSPSRNGGRQMFLAALIEQGRIVLPSGSKMPRSFLNKILEQRTAWFNALPLQDQAAYHQAAKETAKQKDKALSEDIVHFQNAMHLRKVRLAEELRTEGVKNSVTMARFDSDDYASLKALWSDPTLPVGENLKTLRHKSCSAPKHPPPEVMEALQGCPILAAPLHSSEQPAWVKKLCWQRKSIVGSAYATSFEVGSDAFYFLYASQSPLVAYFLPVTVGEPLFPAIESLSSEALLSSWQEVPAFICENNVAGIVPGNRLPLWGEGDINVLPGLAFQPGGLLMTDFQPLPLADFMASLPVLSSGRSERKPAKPAPSKAILKEATAAHPWLEELMASNARPSLPSNVVPLPIVEENSEDESSTAAQNAMDKVWQELDARRQEWAVEAAGQGEDFTSVLRGGPWTQVHMGKAVDRCAATAKQGLPSQWCAQYDLNKIASFSFSVYGEQGAAQLSAEWRKRVQFFYDLWMNSHQYYVFTLEDKAAYHPT